MIQFAMSSFVYVLYAPLIVVFVVGPFCPFPFPRIYDTFSATRLTPFVCFVVVVCWFRTSLCCCVCLLCSCYCNYVRVCALVVLFICVFCVCRVVVVMLHSCCFVMYVFLLLLCFIVVVVFSGDVSFVVVFMLFCVFGFVVVVVFVVVVFGGGGCCSLFR